MKKFGLKKSESYGILVSENEKSRDFLRRNSMIKIKNWLRKEKEETAILLRCIPATVVTLFVVSVVCMNLLANKTLLQLDWIALDGGILISWLSFM